MTVETSDILKLLAANLPATIAAISALIVVVRTHSKMETVAAKVDTVEKQGNSLMEVSLRQRLLLAERNFQVTASTANKAEVDNATLALEGHLRMQGRVARDRDAKDAK